jgi:hypothetical protein
VSRVFVVASLAALGLLGCGGSSSETPWPVEPVGSAFEPVGEGPAPAVSGSGEPVVESPPPR